MRTLGLDVQADGLHFSNELTAEELAQFEQHGPMTCEEAHAQVLALESIISWGDATVMPVAYTDAQWRAVLAERERLGRPLEAGEVRSVVDAVGGLDDHG